VILSRIDDSSYTGDTGVPCDIGDIFYTCENLIGYLFWIKDTVDTGATSDIGNNSDIGDIVKSNKIGDSSYTGDTSDPCDIGDIVYICEILISYLFWIRDTVDTVDTGDIGNNSDIGDIVDIE